MAIRLRVVKGVLVALCAARSVEKPGDVYLDDAFHHALAEKFSEDFKSEGYNTAPYDPVACVLRQLEESNNSNRDWWDRTYAAPEEAPRQQKKDEDLGLPVRNGHEDATGILKKGHQR